MLTIAILRHAPTRIVRPKVHCPQVAVVNGDWKVGRVLGQTLYIRRVCVTCHFGSHQQTCIGRRPQDDSQDQILGGHPAWDLKLAAAVAGLPSDPYCQIAGVSRWPLSWRRQEAKVPGV